ncbi:MAG TPA: hydrogenase maturation nickel metallochaperone HypA [Verrucomicrobiae bacterium]|nr:hydrogenase maturation nickel metallochaperone HypA [Verrucomicrobiae bacterium]
MHEMSVIEALLETASTYLRSYPNPRVQRLHVRVGRLRQLDAAMLEFCFNAAVANSPLDGSELRVEPIEPTARCKVCSLEFDVEDTWFECPRCHDLDAELLKGDELILSSIEIDTEGSHAPLAR